MIVIAGFILGAILGALNARRRKGNLLDMLQYGAGYAILFSVLGLIVTLVIEKVA